MRRKVHPQSLNEGPLKRTESPFATSAFPTRSQKPIFASPQISSRVVRVPMTIRKSGLRRFVWVIFWPDSGLERGKHGREDLESEVLLVA